MATYHVIGQPTRRVDGKEKATGHARYAADVSLPSTLWGKSLHSPYAHARIVRIDTTAAKQVPGVHAVITGADVRGGGLWGRAVKDVPVLAYDRVRFVGERVAAVAADDEDIAQSALDLIEVEYEELPAVFEPHAALKDDAPILHPDFNAYFGFAQKMSKPANAYHRTFFAKGDLEWGFAEADLIIENTYVTQRIHQGYIEPQAVLVNIDDSGRVHVWVCSKVPYNTRESLSTVAGIPEEQILFHHVYIGGDFGGKGNARNTPICYFLAKATGRPVRMVSDYTEELFAGNPRHAVVVRLKTGVKRDGTLTAHQVHYLVNSGAYAAFKPAGVIGGYNQAAGPYRVANCRIESTFVYTNSPPCGFMRAPGEPQAVFALESHIDEIARQLGMDALEFRLKNLIIDGEETASGERSAGRRTRSSWRGKRSVGPTRRRPYPGQPCSPAPANRSVDARTSRSADVPISPLSRRRSPRSRSTPRPDRSSCCAIPRPMMSARSSTPSATRVRSTAPSCRVSATV